MVPVLHWRVVKDNDGKVAKVHNMVSLPCQFVHFFNLITMSFFTFGTKPEVSILMNIFN